MAITNATQSGMIGAFGFKRYVDETMVDVLVAELNALEAKPGNDAPWSYRKVATGDRFIIVVSDEDGVDLGPLPA